MNKNMQKKSITLISFIIILMLAGFIIGQVTQVNIPSWYVGLDKSELTPPNFIFPIVWTLLYLALAYVGWRLWYTKPKTIFTVYCLQMLMNWAWSFLFFHWHLVGLSFFWLLAMIIITFVLILQTWHKHKFTSVLLIIYFAWLIFAAYLNGFIWWHNYS